MHFNPNEKPILLILQTIFQKPNLVALQSYNPLGRMDCSTINAHRSFLFPVSDISHDQSLQIFPSPQDPHSRAMDFLFSVNIFKYSFLLFDYDMISGIYQFFSERASLPLAFLDTIFLLFSMHVLSVHRLFIFDLIACFPIIPLFSRSCLLIFMLCTRTEHYVFFSHSLTVPLASRPVCIEITHNL